MIRGIYETHLEVSDLFRSIQFYQHLGLEFASSFENMAFFWVGEHKKQMLGLWVKPTEELKKNHFAFDVSFEDLTQSIQWLKMKNITVTPSFGLGNHEPIVHTWMPAACVYFYDPDGNSLEFISVLPDQAVKNGGVMYLSEWNQYVKEHNLYSNRTFDPFLSTGGKMNKFHFEDLILLDSLMLQKIFSHIPDTMLLAKAFKNCHLSFTSQLFQCMPKARRVIIVDAMDGLNVKESEIKESQDRIGKIVLELDKRGDIILPTKES